MKDHWNKKSNTEDLYDFATYKPQTHYRSSFKHSRFRVIDLKKHRLVLQILASIIILGLVFGISRLDNAIGDSVGSGARYLLTEEVNLKPVVNKVLQVAGQVSNMEWPTVLNLPTQESKAVIAESANPLSLTIPVSGQITSVYGWFISPVDDMQHFHEGIDIQAPLGSEVKAALSGRVVRTGEDRNMGGYLLIEHDQNYTYYAGLGDVAVKPGQDVREGEIIGKVGLNNESREPHLHFEFRERGKPVDPLARLYPDQEPGKGM
jgi:murein DD-endopeptidase MepM/ murein hydrolase activator NlpD